MQAIAPVEALFEEVTAVLANRCLVDGTLDSESLDLHQVCCYELAFAASELFAAREMLRGTAGAISGLADSFLAQALPSALQRLEGIATALNHDLRTDAIRRSRGFADLQRLGSGVAMAEIGAPIISGEIDFSRIETTLHVDLMRESFFRFGQDHVAPIAAEIHRNDLDIPDTLLSQLREMGVFGLSVPALFGGSAPDDGEDALAMIAVTEALSEASLGAAGSLITRPEILTRAILAGGTDSQKQHWLPRIAAGEPLVAIAITEPDFGSDVASLGLRGRRVGGGWVLNGAKTWCTFAGKAGVLMVVTRTNEGGGHKGLSVMLVEKPSFDGHGFDYCQPSGGRLRGKAIPTIGYRGMHSFDLSFEDFFVPDANVLGGNTGLGNGFYYTMSGMTGGRIQTAGRACGVMAAAIKAAIRHAQDRKVFGRPLGSYQLTQAKIAMIAARYVACRHMAYGVGAMLGKGGGQMEASLAKLYACRSAEIVTREALQIHGGMGYAEEADVSRYFVDARVLSIFEGAEETLALKVVARELLQRAATGGLALAAPTSFP
jgi:(2S)-methylsuccinyl-CoA dehydrogenase